MTITYSLDVASSTLLGFHRLLLRWKGSIWKSIWPELTCWLCIYFSLSIWYRYIMSKQQQILFEDICIFFNTYSDYIPITFMLGFYVSAVFTRWGEIFMNLGWIDSPAILLATIVRGRSEEARNIRRNIIRYLVLVQAMVYRDISACVKKRFPTMDHLVTAGIMTSNELREFDAIETEHIKYWTPIQWAFLLLRRARDQGLVDSDIIYVDMLEKIRQYRVNVLTLTLYDWVPIPLVYTQVVNLAVRSYFLIALFGRQYLIGERKEKTIDLFIPLMSIMQFLFYMGWIKVAEVLLNPLGEDDDDFETNWIIDRNLQVGLCIVDDCYGRVPGLEKDQFWEQSNPQLLYTAESASRPQNPMIGSCNDSNQQEDMLLLQPRRRRLMSTATGPEMSGGAHSNKAFHFDEFYRDKAPVVSDDDENNNNNIVPVYNHNPSRRMSVVYNDGGGPTRILDSIKRKFSRAAPTGGSRSGEHDFEKSFERTQRNSTKSTISNSDIPVQNFLWGASQLKDEIIENKDQPKQNEQKQKTEFLENLNTNLNINHSSPPTSPTKSPSLPPLSTQQINNENNGNCLTQLPAIQEEESCGGEGINSQSSLSIDSVSSTNSSSLVQIEEQKKNSSGNEESKN
uniref:Bestrophin homolog n=1 Tax=Meloidogyne enterolobii TaxID=390850 RepID=A0A6V7UBP0_MELEN|nr:unnamed protein product [Meloidogyne enterolobii]